MPMVANHPGPANQAINGPFPRTIILKLARKSLPACGSETLKLITKLALANTSPLSTDKKPQKLRVSATLINGHYK